MTVKLFHDQSPPRYGTASTSTFALLNGLHRCYLLDKTISKYRVVSICVIIEALFIEILIYMTKSIGPERKF